MSDEARKFIEKQLTEAGVKPSNDAVLEYAMATVELLTGMNMKLYERIRELERKRRRPVAGA